ncbi:putative glycosyl-transferase [Geitlerinema sp. FC II]|nr:glycosyltransferase family 1 protein [Geitlerinema sp. CS-897]PPT08732.1 putative glycosyl-transferase [Geitlerinema sp. FC II]
MTIVAFNSLKTWIKSKLPWTDGITRKLTAKTWPNRSIAFFRGSYPMVTESELREKGASGSEAAVIYLTQAWAKQGYEVTVYANCGDREGIYNGVRYRNFRRMNWYDRFDILLIARHPVYLEPQAKARLIGFEWQDITYPEKFYTREILERFDKIFSKSQYQRRLLPDLPDEKFTIVTNGYDPEILKFSDRKKQPYKLVYASRYYRGLEHMLEYGWPIVKREIPEAELHLFYGFTKYDNHPDRTDWREKMKQLMAQPGVIDRGLVGYDRLMEEKASASIHYYGCTYGEIDCISVRESSIVGCVPVTTDFAVFAEKDYCVKVPGEPMARETQEAIAYKIVELLRNPDRLAEIREKFKDIAKQETWDNIAAVWAREFENAPPR